MNHILHKILGLPIGSSSSGKIPKDGDGDGKFTLPGGKDIIPLPQAAKLATAIVRGRVKAVKADPERKKRMRDSIKKGFTGGFTVDKTAKNDITTGIAVGRNRHGIKKPVSEIFEEDGTPKKEAIRLMMAWLDHHGKEVFNNPLPTAREVGIGGWIENGEFYLDVVDIYDYNSNNLARATQLGKEQNQISVTVLDEIEEANKTNNWTKVILGSGGDGAETLDPKMFDDILDIYSTFQPERQISEVDDPDEKSLLNRMFVDGKVRILIQQTDRKQNG